MIDKLQEVLEYKFKDLMLLQLKLSKSWTTYQLVFHELSSKKSERIFEDQHFTADTIPLKHRIYTNGFLFTERPKDRKLLVHEVLNYNIDKAYFNSIKKGKDIVLDDGTIIPNTQLTEDPPKPKSYAFCSDTAYSEDIIPIITNVTALYHESTFLEKHLKLAELTKHSTAKQAALIAYKAQVGVLVLGHYSARYDDIQLFEDEAKEVFERTIVSNDGFSLEF